MYGKYLESSSKSSPLGGGDVLSTEDCQNCSDCLEGMLLLLYLKTKARKTRNLDYMYKLELKHRIHMHRHLPKLLDTL